MAEWDKTKVHCLVTWITLADLDQTSRGFRSAGNAKTTSLTFWNPGDSAAMRKGKARTVAIRPMTTGWRKRTFSSAVMAAMPRANMQFVMAPSSSAAITPPCNMPV